MKKIFFALLVILYSCGGYSQSTTVQKTGGASLSSISSPTITGTATTATVTVSGGVIVGSTTFGLDEPGTVVPSQIELVSNNANVQALTIKTYGATPGTQNDIHFYRYRGTPGSPSATQSGDALNSIGYRGYGTSAVTQSAAAYIVATDEAWTNTANGCHIRLEVTPIGSAATSRVQALRVHNAGGIIVGQATAPVSGEQLSVQFGSTGAVGQIIKNSTAGTGAYSYSMIQNSVSDYLAFYVPSASYTSSGGFAAGAGIIRASHAAGLNLVSGNASGAINFYAAGTATANLRASVNGTGLALYGSTSGTTTLKAAATAGSTTITLPAGTTDFSATGGTSNFVKQNSAGAAFTVAQPAMADISDLPVVSSGTYTPTLTNVTNVAASTAYVNNWMRVGNTVTVSGRVDIDITTSLAATEMGMSLPIASAFTINDQGGGASSGNANEQTANVRLLPDVANDRIQFYWTGQVGTGNIAYSFIFTYRIL